ncbi:MAG TPA: hypothetical protein VF533_08050 [Solirubrobacteraceae bacterium]|jgi:septal ring factor EnvC (AmiA/AmiB activator)
MTPPVPRSAPAPPSDLQAARTRLRRAERQSPDDRAVRAPWWQGTLALLEEREAEARKRLAETREELQRATLENGRLTALLGARDAELEAGARRVADLQARMRSREQEAIAARSELAGLVEVVEEQRRRVVTLTAERDAATKAAEEAAKRAELSDSRLRAATKSLRTRTAQLGRLEEQVVAHEKKIAWLSRRSDRLRELQESRSYAIMRRMWRLRALLRLR